MSDDHENDPVSFVDEYSAIAEPITIEALRVLAIAADPVGAAMIEAFNKWVRGEGVRPSWFNDDIGTVALQPIELSKTSSTGKDS